MQVQGGNCQLSENLFVSTADPSFPQLPPKHMKHSMICSFVSTTFTFFFSSSFRLLSFLFILWHASSRADMMNRSCTCRLLLLLLSYVDCSSRHLHGDKYFSRFWAQSLPFLSDSQCCVIAMTSPFELIFFLYLGSNWSDSTCYFSGELRILFLVSVAFVSKLVRFR